MRGADVRQPGPGRGLRIAGRVAFGLLVAFLASDIAIHLAKHPEAVKAAQSAGYDPGLLPLIGAIELVCVVLYAIPRTARLGVVLLTGYLGGASATNLVTGAGSFAVVFAPIVGALLWASLWTRDAWARQIVSSPKGSVP